MSHTELYPLLPSSCFTIYSCATLGYDSFPLPVPIQEPPATPGFVSLRRERFELFVNMPVNSKSGNRKGISGEPEKNRRGKLPEKAMSFHGRGTIPHSNSGELRRPKTLPELFSNGQTIVEPVSSIPPRLTKLLLNVTVQGSLGALQIIISPESTVNDLIDATIRLYVKEARRPFLPDSEPSRFDLHYSQFSLESIGREQKLISLGSRNFFMCGRNVTGGVIGGGSPESCSKEAEKVAKTGFHWRKFIGF